MLIMVVADGTLKFYCIFSHLILLDASADMVYLDLYSKLCLKWPLKNSHNQVLMENGSVIMVKSIPDWSFLQYFLTAVSKTNFWCSF